MNQNAISLKNEILNKLKISSINPTNLKELIEMINLIFQGKQQYQQHQFKIKHEMLEIRLQQLSTQLTTLNEIIKKKSGMFSIFKQNDDIQNIQQKIFQEIQNLHYIVKEFIQDSSLITLSDYTSSKEMIDLDLITINTTINLYHPKIIPIKSQLNCILKQGANDDIFELAVLRKELMNKLKQKAVQKLDKNQERYLKKFEGNQTNIQVFVAEYARLTQITTFSSEIYPYVVSVKNQNRIYLCNGMKLRFFPNQTLIVLETNTKNQDLSHFSTVTQDDNKNSTNCIKILGYGYIKFQYEEIYKVYSQNLQQSIKEGSESIPSKGATFEFYLKNQHLSISQYIPLIDATLFHDDNGFYMLPIKTELQNYYYLYYDKQIQTKFQKYTIGLQIKGKGWIQIETEKGKEDNFGL